MSSAVQGTRSGESEMGYEEEAVETAMNGTAVTAQRVDARNSDAAAKAHPTIVMISDPFGASAEAIRGLYYSLRRSLGGAPLGVLGIVSATRGEGRSTMAANLAFCAARETGQPTALVDGDLREPNLHELIGVEGEVGLSDVLANRADYEAITVEHPAGVTFVPGGRPEPEPARRYTSPRFARFLAQVRHRFDEVIVDLPPLTYADSRLVAPQCTGVLLVVRSGVTDGNLVQEAVSSLDGVKVLGAVLNDVAESEAPMLRATRKALPAKR